jgi:hypothetical protein
MNFKKCYLISGLLALIILCFVSAQALAGMDPPPQAPLGADEAWGVVIIDCSAAGDKIVLLRAKKIVDCAVQTDHAKLFVTNCPTTPEDVIDAFKTGLSLFGQSPIVTNVKNFNCNQSDLCSFDVQIKFFEQ